MIKYYLCTALITHSKPITRQSLCFCMGIQYNLFNFQPQMQSLFGSRMWFGIKILIFEQKQQHAKTTQQQTTNTIINNNNTLPYITA